MNSKQRKQNKVLFVCQHFWPETFRINDIAEFFVEKDCHVDVLCGLPNYPSGKFVKGYGYFKKRRQVYKGVHIERALEIPRGNNSNFRIFINYISFPIFSLLHLPRLMTRDYSKIYVFTYSPIMMALTGILLGRIKNIEVTMAVLDLWPENLFSVLPLKNKFLRKLITQISYWHYRNVEKMIVPSIAMGKRMQEISNLPSKRIIALPQACEKIYEKDIINKKLKNRFAKGFNAVFTGNISPAQSFETVIKAATIIRESGIEDINWIIVGEGMSKEWLINQVKSAGLEDAFFFEGQHPIEDIPQYTTIADVLFGCLVKSDLLEASIPAKVTSYLAAGRPMVMAIDGEARQLINEKAKCGFAGPTENAKVFAQNIIKVYKMSPEERKNIGGRGRAFHFKYLERNIVLKRMYEFVVN